MRELKKLRQRRFLAALLVVILALGLIAAGEMPGDTEETGAVVCGSGVPDEDVSAAAPEVPSAEKTLKKVPLLKLAGEDSPLVLSKTAVYDAANDKIHYKLESYATGASIITEKAAPTDIVLVVDLSNSMWQSNTKDLLDENGVPMYRSTALVQAVSAFIDKFHEVDPNGESYRISIVSFSGNPGTSQYGYVYLFDGANAYNDTSAIQSHAAGSLKPVNNTGVTALKQSINTTIFKEPKGDNTYPVHGLEMAETVFNARTDASDRNSVVVFFTDGTPGTGTGNGHSMHADPAIEKAYTLKNDPDIQATIFTVGLFEMNDANKMNYKYNNNPTYDPGTYSIKAYMEAVSSKYPNARTEEDPDYYKFSDGSRARRLTGLSPEVTDAQYYHKLDTSSGPASISQLESIFNSIAETIKEESGGAATQLDQSAVVLDSVMPFFTASSAPANISLSTAEYLGGENWAAAQPEGTATASASGNKISVTGFNFSENWVGYTTDSAGQHPRGKKLIVEFDAPTKPLYLGGSQTQTNGDDSGVYQNAQADTYLDQFALPTANVPLKTVKPKLDDKHVYLTQDADVVSNLITNSTTFVVGNGQEASFTELFDGINNANTDVSFMLKDENGNVIGTYTVPHGSTTGSWTWTGGSQPALTGDKYTLSSCVQDIADASNKAEVDAAMNIYIYKPEMTFRDQTKYYGDSITYPRPSDIVWKCGDKVADPAVMIGSEPSLGITQKPKDTASTVKANDTEYVAVTSDFPVSVSIAVGGQDMTSLLFQENKISRACDTDSSHTATSASDTFVVHVKTLSLTVIKHVDGLFANKTRSYDFEVSFSHPALNLSAKTFSLRDNGTQTIASLPKGATITVKENNVPALYTVMMNEVEGNPQNFTLNEENLTVEVQNVLESIPITGVVAGHGPEVLIAFLAALALAGFIMVKAETRRRYHR